MPGRPVQASCWGPSTANADAKSSGIGALREIFCPVRGCLRAKPDAWSAILGMEFRVRDSRVREIRIHAVGGVALRASGLKVSHPPPNTVLSVRIPGRLVSIARHVQGGVGSGVYAL